MNKIEETIEQTSVNNKRKWLLLKKALQFKKDDFAVIDFAGSVDGKPFDGGEGKSYPLQIGSGNFIPGLRSIDRC